MTLKKLGLADPGLLAKIDRLADCGAGVYVDLPQLIVVGDQSSGKSSVLEGLTGVPFPRDSKLCTRWATQISFKRSAEKCVTISLSPSENSTAEDKEQLREWGAHTTPGGLDPDSFKKILIEAEKVMGVDPAAGKNFSEHMLKVDVCGPDEEHFSVIDVPGIFHARASGMINTDKALVDKIVEDFMGKARSIILAVVSANAHPATQAVIERAAKHDPEGDRTVCILTKADIVDKGSEDDVVNLARGRSFKNFKLGYYIVVNPGQRNLENVQYDRETEERKFFSQSPWNKVDKERCGIANLRLALKDILHDHVRSEFPKIREELSKKLEEARRELRGLGRDRSSTQEQRLYLCEISHQFEIVKTAAVNGNYASSEEFQSSDDLHLAKHIMDRSRAFARDIERYGHTYEFAGSHDLLALPTMPREGDEQEADITDDFPFTFTPPTTPDKTKSRPVRYQKDLSEVVHIVLDRAARINTSTSEKASTWLQTLHKRNRGFELNTYNHHLLALAFQEQSCKWKMIALGYISDLIVIIQRFIGKLTSLVCENRKVQTSLLARLQDDLLAQYKSAINHVHFLLGTERSEIPMALGPRLWDFQNRARSERMEEAEKHFAEEKEKSDDEDGEEVDAGKVLYNVRFSDERHAVWDLHDNLLGYYSIAGPRFIDNVCKQAAVHYLVAGPDNPLEIFSPSFVNRLTDQELDEIAGEDEKTKRRRKDLLRQIEVLEETKVVTR